MPPFLALSFSYSTEHYGVPVINSYRMESLAAMWTLLRLYKVVFLVRDEVLKQYTNKRVIESNTKIRSIYPLRSQVQGHGLDFEQYAPAKVGHVGLGEHQRPALAQVIGHFAGKDAAVKAVELVGHLLDHLQLPLVHVHRPLQLGHRLVVHVAQEMLHHTMVRAAERIVIQDTFGFEVDRRQTPVRVVNVNGNETKIVIGQFDGRQFLGPALDVLVVVATAFARQLLVKKGGKKMAAQALIRLQTNSNKRATSGDAWYR